MTFSEPAGIGLIGLATGLAIGSGASGLRISVVLMFEILLYCGGGFSIALPLIGLFSNKSLFECMTESDVFAVTGTLLVLRRDVCVLVDKLFVLGKAGTGGLGGSEGGLSQIAPLKAHGFEDCGGA